MAKIHFQCPKCGAETELQLPGSGSMLLLSCSECRCPLMYFAGQAFEIDGAEFNQLKGRQMKAVEGFMKVHRTSRRAQGAARAELGARLQPVKHKAGEPLIDHAIGNEDITDLIIDLETSEDVEDFLRRIG